MTTTPKSFQALDSVIQALMHECHPDQLAAGAIPVDAVLVVGTQRIDDDGDRVGGVFVFPRNGSQPYYQTTGLLDAARDLLYARAHERVDE
ncbi:hypothetical protein [Mycobacterium sp. 1465703.0]|uniref:DUF7213 family protein n=1 Tax=Mycobacterium sp. 1465703.0 TaxID=1834078 RepID=UPI000ACEC109|nr:hypothetical protein [Mycobacterium sp. 1465703.0]